VTPAPRLEVAHVSKRFGGLAVLTDVTLGVEAGSIQALIGPNGAGKTTLLNIVSGYLPPDTGSVRFGERDLTRWPASRRVAAGLARTFQIVQVFGGMTVLDNVLCGFHLHVKQSVVGAVLGLGIRAQEERELRDRARELLALVDLSPYAGQRASLLPFGLQRRLEVARALATKPAVLLLDEPCAGLSGPEVSDLGVLLRRLAAGGTTVLIVEHNMPFVLDVAERVAVLDAGQLIANGSPAAVRTDARVIEAYLGESERVHA
jgi:branched-chain amino acid transport system ATP-binding protein